MNTTKAFGRVLYEVEDGIATATMDFQERLNALGPEIRSGLLAVLNEVDWESFSITAGVTCRW